MALNKRIARVPWAAGLIAGLAAMLIAGLFAGARPVVAADGDPLAAEADVSVTGPSGVGGNVDDTVHFSVVVANAGPGTASGVTLSAIADLSNLAVMGLPDGVTCAASVALSCPLGDLEAGSSLALTVEGTILFPCGGMLTTSVTATTSDPSPGNNQTTGDYGQPCEEYQPPDDPCLDEFGNWTCSVCDPGSIQAGDDQVVTEGDLVTLSGAWETDGAVWSQPGGPLVPLSDAAIAAPTFVAPQVDADTVLTFVLEGWACAGPIQDSVVETVLAAPAPLICPSPQGYWKNASIWPAQTLQLGSQVFGSNDLRSILATPVRKDARLILAVQLIAARLSLAAGAPDSTTSQGPASGVADAASILLVQAGGSLFAKGSAVSVNSADGRQMTRLATALEAYARGELTVGCAG